MAYLRLQSAAVALALMSCAGVANAADYSPPQPCYDAAVIASGRAPPGAVPCYVPPPPVVVDEFSGWYLRGDIGMSNQQVKGLSNPAASTPILSSSYGFDAAPILGLGVGYYFNDWLRFDVTGEYRGRANFHGREIYAGPQTDEYNGSKSEWLFLANAYVDLGTWNNLTPFVGAGLGFSRNSIHNFQDACHACGGVPVNTGISFAEDASKWNFAWAVHAGLGYRVNNNLTVELAYRYLDLGDAASGDLVTYTGVNNVYNPMEFRNITSHDVKLGVRWMLNPEPVYAPPPLMRKG